MSKIRVGVLGGGLLGCCTALELARRGAEVVVFERNDTLITGTSLNNDGKIHLGYVYGGDPTLQTARMMVRGATTFAPFLERHLGIGRSDLGTSSNFLYPVLREGDQTADEVTHYFAKVHELGKAACEEADRHYFSNDLREPPRRWAPAEVEAAFDTSHVAAVFETDEIAIDPQVLASLIRDRVAATPSIEIRAGQTVKSVAAAATRLKVTCGGADGAEAETFDHVVNALWDRRLTIDATLGIHPRRRWLHRFRYGLRLTANRDLPPFLSMTIIHGPFGGLVAYENGDAYFSWYPAGRVEMSDQIEPPEWPIVAEEPFRSRVINGTVSGLAGVFPALRGMSADRMADVSVIGGNVFAWGKTDIHDPVSELHARDDIGIVTRGTYHSVDVGKLTTGPYFAELCADRILPQ